MLIPKLKLLVTLQSLLNMAMKVATLLIHPQFLVEYTLKSTLMFELMLIHPQILTKSFWLLLNEDWEMLALQTTISPRRYDQLILLLPLLHSSPLVLLLVLQVVQIALHTWELTKF